MIVDSFIKLLLPLSTMKHDTREKVTIGSANRKAFRKPADPCCKPPQPSPSDRQQGRRWLCLKQGLLSSTEDTLQDTGWQRTTSACSQLPVPTRTPKLLCHPALGTLGRPCSSCGCNPTLIPHGGGENCLSSSPHKTMPLGDHRETAGWWHTLLTALEQITQRLQAALEVTLTGS